MQKKLNGNQSLSRPSLIGKLEDDDYSYEPKALETCTNHKTNITKMDEQQNHKKQDRREFLKKAGTFAAGSFMAAALPWFTFNEAHAANGQKVKIGMIGPGSRGQLLLHHLKANPDVEITALCDIYQPSIDRAVEILEFRPDIYTDYRKLLEDKSIEAVIIATPQYQHPPQTIDALEAGKQVFCEKSMALTIPEAIAMARASRRTGKILQIGHQRMFNPRYIKAMEMIAEGRIGTIGQIRAYWHRNNNWRRESPPHLEKQINWRLYRYSSGGLMTELGSHQVQVANWALGAPPRYVSGSGSVVYWKDGREVYDNVNVVFNYPGDVHMIYDSMISNKKYGLEEQILGSRGTLEPEANRLYSENPPAASGIRQLLHDIEKDVFSTVPIGGASWVPDRPVEDKGEPILDQYPQPDDTALQMEAFVRAVQKGQPYPGLLEQGLQASVAALMGLEAMHTHRTVYWPKEADEFVV